MELLTRGMGEQITYGILAHCHVLVECLGGLFFDGRCSCTRDSFPGYWASYRGDSLVVSILVRRALNRSMLLLVTAYLS